MRRRTRLAGLVAALSMIVLLPAVASAHPLGNFTINHYAGIRVGPHGVDVDVVIDMAEIPTLDEVAILDANHDGSASAAELDAARAARCTALAPQLHLAVGGATLGLQLIEAGLQLRSGSAGLNTLRLVCELSAPVSVSDRVQLTFSDTSYADRIGWREISIRGDAMTVTGPASATGVGRDVTERLTHYPTDLLQQPLDQRSLTAQLSPGGPALAAIHPDDASPLDGAATSAASSAAAAAASIPGGALIGSVDLRHLSPALVLLGLLLAMLAGAGHAVSPGHGKTLMAAYLIGTRGRPRDALLLGSLVTVSHTAGVLALAAVVLFAGRILPPERLYPILSAVSGLTVVGIGLVLLVGCLRGRWSAGAREHSHRHQHAHEDEHAVAHSHGGVAHVHAPMAAPGWRGLAAIGIAGGMVPSTAALILLLGAVAAGQPAYGIALAAAFGVGMAAVLSGIGFALVRGRDRMGRLAARVPRLERLQGLLPWGAATVVLASGIFLSSQALLRPAL